ncbi:MAG: alpha/beta hydrolase [Sphingomonadaceae bacterium]
MAKTELLGPTSHSFTSQRLRLHYNDWGNASAPPLLLLHGGHDHSRSWDWTASRLREDWHVIAPDLRGHGDSQWSSDGNYGMAAYVYDLAQLVHQLGFQQLSIVAHSLGGAIALRYVGLYPELVRRLVVIEGTGMLPRTIAAQMEKPVEERFRHWIEEQRAISGRLPRRYATLEDALERMRVANPNLNAEQTRHLTIHAVDRNEDGSYGWKFDNYLRVATPVDMSAEDLRRLWARISCPVLFCWGSKSWAVHPAEDGTLDSFQNARVAAFEGAGHWLHHDQFEPFMAELRAFL